ncbi:MAG: hypothetical protein IPI69_10235 [Bacteroidales bacterium]|nr:hypothetical protein [Bacteroidales bacterium]
MHGINPGLIPGSGTWCSILPTAYHADPLLSPDALQCRICTASFLLHIVVSRETTGDKYIALTFFPVLYYLAGAFGLIFTGMFIVYSLVLPERTPQVSNAAGTCRSGRINVLLSDKFLITDDIKQRFLHPLPDINDSLHGLMFSG